MRWTSLLLLTWLAIWIGPRPLHAQDAGIHRCVDHAGRLVFTDRICADVDATPALPGDNAGSATSPVDAPPRYEDRSAQLCAATLDALRQQIVDAFAARDPNRLAGLMLWDGYSRRGVVEQIRALGVLMQQPLLEVSADGPAHVVQTAPFATDLYDASQPLGPQGESVPAGNDSTRPPAAVILVTGPRDASGASTSTRLALITQSGCLWLRPAD
ncbi:MAG: DUF4124 domain-containing protein [Dyella sp.]|uniref:DUF4124 domain-containing protein n=1 Tax=Dyella sp. TaxID=1869338 RepID=UPI003F7E9FC6